MKRLIPALLAGLIVLPSSITIPLSHGFSLTLFPADFAPIAPDQLGHDPVVYPPGKGAVLRWVWRL